VAPVVLPLSFRLADVRCTILSNQIIQFYSSLTREQTAKPLTNNRKPKILSARAWILVPQGASLVLSDNVAVCFFEWCLLFHLFYLLAQPHYTHSHNDGFVVSLFITLIAFEYFVFFMIHHAALLNSKRHLFLILVQSTQQSTKVLTNLFHFIKIKILIRFS
jgi:hypothetical protein